MKLTMEQTAYVVGKSKKTIYNHKDANKFTWENNDEGTAILDASELIRVYGSDNGISGRLKELQGGDSVSKSEITPNYTPKPSVKKLSLSDEDYIEFIKLRAEKQYKDERISDLESEKDKWEKLAQEAQKSVQNITLLLEDHTSKSEKDDSWQRSIRALESRIANQEKAEKDRLEREQKILDENKRIKQAYSKQKKELEAEKNKSFFQRLFG